MNKLELQNLVKDGETWAAVENYIVQEIENFRLSKENEIILLIKEKEYLSGLLANAKELFINGENEKIEELIIEVNKSEKDKEIEAARLKLMAAQEELDKLSK